MLIRSVTWKMVASIWGIMMTLIRTFMRLSAAFRKQWILLGVLVALTAFLLAYTSTGVQCLMNAYDESYASAYGKHDVIFVEEQPFTAQELFPSGTAFGYMEDYGEYCFQGTHVHGTLGSFDDQAFRTAHLAVLEGRLPESAGEIILEEYLFDQIPDLQVGSHCVLQSKEGQLISVSICGVVSNYSSQWNIPWTASQLSLNPLPSVIGVSGLNDWGVPNSYMCAIDTPEYDQAYINVDPSRLSFQTNSAYHEAATQEIERMEILQRLFEILILVSSFFMLERVLTLIFHRYSRVQHTLSAVGTPQTFSFALIAIPSVVVYFAGVPVGCASGMYLTSITLDGYGDHFATSIAPSLIALTAIFWLTLILKWRNFCFSRSRHSEADQSLKRLSISAGSSFSNAFGRLSFRLYFRRQGTLILGLCMAIMALSALSIYKVYASPSYLPGPEFEIKPHTAEMWETVGYYNISDVSNDELSMDNVRTLESLPEESIAIAYLDTNYTTLDIPDLPNDIISGFNEYPGEFSSLSHAIPELEKPVCTNWHMILGTPRLMEMLTSKYDIGLDEAALFFPEYTGSAPEFITVAKATKRSQTGVEKRISSSSEIAFSFEEVGIGAVLSEPFDITINDINLRLAEPVLIVPSKMALSSDVLNRLQQVDVYANGDTNFKDLNNKLRSFAAEFTEPFFYSRYESNLESERKLHYMSWISLLVACTLIAYMLLVFVLLSLESMDARKPTLRVLFVLGTPKIAVHQSLLIEFSLYIFVFAMIALGLTTLLCGIFGYLSAALPIFACIAGISGTFLVAIGILVRRFVSDYYFGESSA